MLRRLLLTISLALLFGLGQQGAVTHAVSHLTDLQQRDSAPDKSHHAPSCDKCVVYAALGNAVGSSAWVLPAIPQAFHPHAALTSRAGAILHRPYSARAPPVPA